MQTEVDFREQSEKASLILVQQIEPRILSIRGQRVILDADLAQL